MPTFKKSGNAYSHSAERYYATSVSKVPQDVSDEDALSGAWKRRMTPPKTAQVLGMEKIWNLRRQYAGKIWKTERLESEVVYKQRD